MLRSAVHPMQRSRKGSLVSLLAGNTKVRALDSEEEAQLILASASQKLAPTWIEQTFKRRECGRFVPSVKDPNRCGCGRSLKLHRESGELGPLGGAAGTAESAPSRPSRGPERWVIQRDSYVAETNAFGTIEFQGGPHPTKAQYVRLGFDSDPADILELFRKVWGIKPPKLVITVHGGMANFELQPKLARVFRKGLLKAAKTTGAWIITSGINVGVVRQVAAALTDGLSNRSAKSKIVTIGIAPWGLLKKREELLGKDRTVAYHPRAFSPKGKLTVLNHKHNYFLLVDNGTVGRYGADIILRKRLEEHISKQTIGSDRSRPDRDEVSLSSRGEGRRKNYLTGGRCIPVVCVVLEGGQCTIRSVLDYVMATPPVPVVVCDGSGRAADLLAFTYHHTAPSLNLSDAVKEQLLSLVVEVFRCRPHEAQAMVQELQLCVRKRDLITVFRLGEDSQTDVDHSILTALLKGQGNLAPSSQLSLALAWNRVDIARSEIFVLGTDWPQGSLDAAMMEALVEDRVEFVKLLLENGVSMERFLTIQRLEELYNTQRGPPSSVRSLVRSTVGTKGPISLKDVGLTMEALMGSAYVARYCGREFGNKYELWRQFRSRVAAGDLRWKNRLEPGSQGKASDGGLLSGEPDFPYPFNELLVWAVLSGRTDMARCMWSHGEEALAKALVAAQLNRAMAAEAAADQLDLDLRTHLLRAAADFKRLGLELVEHCYHADRRAASRLLTYELKNWGGQTCLSLGVIAGHKELIAHSVCQMLLADLWHGGLSTRKSSNLKVIAGLLFPPFIFRLDFKTKDELLLQPQTAEEHAEEMREWSSSSESSSSASVSSDSDSPPQDVETGFRRRKHRRRTSSRLWAATSELSLASAYGRHNSVSPAKTEPTSGLANSSTNPLRQPVASLSSSLRRLGNWSFRSQQPAAVTLAKASGGGGNRVVFATNSLPLKSRAQSEISGMQSSGGTSETTEPRKKRALGLRKKLYEFYVAPITTFWFFTLSYLVFLGAFTFTVLVRTPERLSWVEVCVAVYVLTMGFDMLCKILMLEPRGLGHKLRLWLGRGWNVVRSLAVGLYVLGLCLRASLVEEEREAGRVLLTLDIILWYIQLLEICMVNADLGLYMTMIMKMVVKAAGILLILLVVLTAFGVAWQALRFQKEDWHWQLLRNVFYKPYFMLYGEVYAGEIDECGDRGENCIAGVWLAPAVMFLFLLVANILLINLLIAIFNNIFQAMNAQSQELWRFGRYFQVMEYEASPPLPPPFVLVCDLWRLSKMGRHLVPSRLLPARFRPSSARSHAPGMDFSLKLFLSAEALEELHDFEEECMEDLHQEKLARRAASQEEKVARTADRVEHLSIKLTDLLHKQHLTKTALYELEKKLLSLQSHLENLDNQALQKDFVDQKVTEMQDQLQLISNRLALQKSEATLASYHAHSASLPPDNTQLRRKGRKSSVGSSVGDLSNIQSSDFIHTKAPPLATFHLPLGSSSESPPKEDTSVDSLHQRRLSRKRSDQGLTMLHPPSDPTLQRQRQGSSPSKSPNRRQSAQGALAVTRAQSVPEEDDDQTGPRSRHSFPTAIARHGLEHLSSYPGTNNTTPYNMGTQIPRIRVHDEYTSITDRIRVETERKESVRLGPVREEEAEREAAEDWREFEETSSRLTGALLADRIRKESQSLTETESRAELRDMGRDMGLEEVDAADYLAVLQSPSRLSASSQESLSSARLEDPEGFHQISQCLLQAQADSTPQASGDPTPQVQSPALPTSPSASSGARAGQMFSFQLHKLQDFVAEQEAAQALAQHRPSHSDDE